MANIQQIQQALLSINEAKFQDFCNTFLYLKGYEFLSEPGSVIGKEKTRKGIPDSYIPINEDEYIFVEYTTKERLGNAKSFFEKLSADIDHCFDEEKSKIKNHQIRKIILCFTNKLKVHEHDALRKKCNAKGVEFEPYSIEQLSKAARLYPSLGKDLNISIDTNQILLPIDFVNEYESGRGLATPLSNTLYFRDDDVYKAIAELSATNLLVISGAPGVGKSRFALEIMKKFCASNQSYQSFCISNKDCPIYEDVRTYLRNDKDYIILVDDANRATKHFEFLINIFKEKRAGKFKIIATVRDYALRTVEDLSTEFSPFKIKLNSLSDKQIREILESDDFNITNRSYSNIIVKVAQGNPRLAIMAARVALEKQDMSAFDEVPKIYDNYYDKVIKEIDALGDRTYLKVLGLISFFRAIDKDYNYNEEVFSVFNMSSSDFWERVVVLHQMEIVDLFENEVVKIADQILGTYFFYKTFIREEILSFSDLLISFYKKYENKFKDVIFPVTNTFGFDHVKEKIVPHLNKVWKKFSEYEDDKMLLKLFSVFWIFQQDEVLLYLGQRLAKLPESNQEEYVFETNDNFRLWDSEEDNYYNILKEFLKYSFITFPLAIDLLFHCLEKQPSNISKFIKYTKDQLTFDKEDYPFGFYRQSTLFEKLIKNIESQRNEKLYTGIYYHLATTFLQTAFQKSEGVDRDNSLTIYTYPIPSIPPIEAFRARIWNFCFSDFSKNRQQVVKLIGQYLEGDYLFGVKDETHKIKLWAFDANLLLTFIQQNFNKEDYLECKVAQLYFEKLKDLEIEFDTNLIEYFTNRKYVLSLKLDQDLIYGQRKYDLANDPNFKNENNKRDWDAILDLKIQELKEFTDGYELEDYKQFCLDVAHLMQIEGKSGDWNFRNSLAQILRILANKDASLLLSVLQYIFSKIDTFDTFLSESSRNLVYHALNNLKEEEFHKLYQIITNSQLQDKLIWQFAFFEIIDAKFVNELYLHELFNAFKAIEGYSVFHNNLDFLSKFQEIYTQIKDSSKNIYVDVAYILLPKVVSEKANISFGWDFISNHHYHFLNDIPILKEIYLANYKNDFHFDYDQKELKKVFELAPDFLIELLEKNQHSEFSYSTRDLPIHNFKFVWESDNYVEIMDGLMTFALSKSRIFSDTDHFANRFFEGNESQDKKVNYINSFILANSQNKEAIRLIFNVITYSFYNKRLEFLRIFLEANKNPEIFEGITFHRNGVYSGSRIPRLDERIAFLHEVELLIDALPNSMNYIGHKMIVKREIGFLNKEKHWERRREFDDFFK